MHPQFKTMIGRKSELAQDNTVAGVLAAIRAGRKSRHGPQNLALLLAGPPAEVEAFVKFLSDNAGSMGTQDHETVRTLPVFRTCGGQYLSLDGGSTGLWLPPPGADTSCLGNNFLDVKIRTAMGSRPDVPREQLYRKLGLKEMEMQELYLEHVLSGVCTLRERERDKIVFKLLSDLPSLSSEDAGFVAKLQRISFLTCDDQRVRAPGEVYLDVAGTGLREILGGSNGRFVEGRYHNSGLSSFLPLLEMRTRLDKAAVLQCARDIEGLGVESLSRAAALLKYLDTDFIIELGQTGGSLKELLQIRWLPVLAPADPLLPSTAGTVVSLAAPMEVRPNSQAHLCSLSHFILEGLEPLSASLLAFFGWDVMPTPFQAAHQLLAVADKYSKLERDSGEAAETAALVATAAFDLLASESNASASLAAASMALRESTVPWIWLGAQTGFVSPSTVALNSAVIPTPLLPVLNCEQSSKYGNFLRLCGVREVFQAEDYFRLLRTISQQTETEKKASWFASSANSQLSNEELMICLSAVVALAGSLGQDKAAPEDVPVPTRTKTLRPAHEMFFNDVPWKSGGRGKDQSFAHSSLAPEIARRVGVKSWREEKLQLGRESLSHGGEVFGQKQPLTTRLRGLL
jgi:hypothetical protein